MREVIDLRGVRDLVLVCGRYEGIDERVRDFVDEEISIGDYVLSGGEIAALAVIDAVVRLLPGALGNAESRRLPSRSPTGSARVPAVHPAADRSAAATFRRCCSPATTRPSHAGGAEAARDVTRRVAARSARARGTRRERLSMAPLYLALLHFPVYDKNGQVVTTAVTNMDIHDIARAGLHVRRPLRSTS